ncbi:T9SS type A sorting domain-containing protein [bacterium]|nr:T9SS type A sorting domain-containing protein [bacterium]
MGVSIRRIHRWAGMMPPALAAAVAVSILAAAPDVPAGPDRIVTGNVRLNDDPGTGWQSGPVMAMNLHGAAVFVWMDGRNGDAELYGQRVGIKGLAAGSNFKVTEDGWGGFQFNPAVAINDAGHFVVVWEERKFGTFDLYGKLFAANGVPIREEFMIAQSADLSEYTASPAAAMDSAGNFVVCWNWTKGAVSNIYFRRFDARGEPVGAAFRVNDRLTGHSKHPDVGMNRSGAFAIAWEDEWSGIGEVLAQRFDADGRFSGANLEISDLEGQTEPAREPAVAVNQIGFLCVTFTCKSPGSETSDIFAHLYYLNDQNRTILVSDPSLNLGDGKPDVVSDFNIMYRIAWQTLDSADVFSRYVGGSGVLYGGPNLISGTPAQETVPCIGIGGYGQIVHAWQDDRNGNADIYATLDAVGCPGGVTAGGGFRGMIPLSWNPVYGSSRNVTYRISRTSIPRDSLGTGEGAVALPLFTPVAVVDAASRPYPKMMLDWIDTDVRETEAYLYEITADIEGSDEPAMTFEWASPSDGYRMASSWAGEPPVVDGVLSPGEWDDATGLRIQCRTTPRPVTLRLKNDGETLYIAGVDSNDGIVDPLNVLGVLVDWDRNGAWDAAAPSDEGAWLVASAGTSFTGYFGNYPDGFGMMNIELNPSGVRGAVAASAGTVQYEASIDLPADHGSSLGFAVWIDDPGSLYGWHYGNAGEWPPNALWEAAETLGELVLATETGISERHPNSPESPRLERNFPNPFNPSTMIRFRVKEAGRVSLKVFDILGREVTVLADRGFDPGPHAIRFDAEGLPSGVYLARLQAGDFTAALKMIKTE